MGPSGPDAGSLPAGAAPRARARRPAVETCSREGAATSRWGSDDLFSFCTWLRAAGYTDNDPFRGLRNVRLPRKIVPPLAPAAIARLIACCDAHTVVGRRDRAILLTLLDTGVRCAEAVGLDLAACALTEQRLLVRQGKGGKDRVVPFAARCGDALAAYLAGGRGAGSTLRRRPLRAPQRRRPSPAQRAQTAAAAPSSTKSSSAHTVWSWSEAGARPNYQHMNALLGSIGFEPATGWLWSWRLLSQLKPPPAPGYLSLASFVTHTTKPRNCPKSPVHQPRPSMRQASRAEHARSNRVRLSIRPCSPRQSRSTVVISLLHEARAENEPLGPVLPVLLLDNALDAIRTRDFNAAGAPPAAFAAKRLGWGNVMQSSQIHRRRRAQS